MRAPLWIAVVVAACAPGEKQPGAAAGAEKYTGTWEGRAYRDASDPGTPFRTVMARVADGTLRGTLTYPGSTRPPVPIRVREFSDTSFVQEIGPYYSLVANKEVLTRAVARVTGDSLSGTFEMRPPGGGDVMLRGTYWAKRVAP